MTLRRLWGVEGVKREVVKVRSRNPKGKRVGDYRVIRIVSRGKSRYEAQIYTWAPPGYKLAGETGVWAWLPVDRELFGSEKSAWECVDNHIQMGERQ